MDSAIDTPPTRRPAFNLVAQAQRAADLASSRAGVRMQALVEVEELRPASDLLLSVWGWSPEGVPMSSETMRSLVHADGLVSGAYDAHGDLAGVAVLGRAGSGGAYSYIAGTRPGRSDAGVGFALKQHQRAWALAHDIHLIGWTFDPLVSRNARFNITKLGAVVHEYEHAFYGQMSDELNGTDTSDRLVASWDLGSDRAIAASEGIGAHALDEPASAALTSAENGPDGAPAWIDADADRWCRVPADIIAIRRDDPAQATAWRSQIRRWLAPSFEQGWVAVSVSRTGWYHLTKESS